MKSEIQTLADRVTELEDAMRSWKWAAMVAFGLFLAIMMVLLFQASHNVTSVGYE